MPAGAAAYGVTMRDEWSVFSLQGGGYCHFLDDFHHNLDDMDDNTDQERIYYINNRTRALQRQQDAAQ